MNIKKIKVVIPVSGGKDSQACMKLAVKRFKASEILGLFCDTKFEHPLTYKHLDFMAEKYNVKIIKITAGSLAQKVVEHNRFPGGGARFCTNELKIIPAKKFYEELAKKQGGFEVWYGMRSDESKEREKRYKFLSSNETYPAHVVIKSYPKRLEKLGVTFKLPILDWATDEVFDFLDAEEINPLYGAGFNRVSCFPCLAAGDGSKKEAFIFDEIGRKHFKIIEKLEKKVDFSIWKSKKESMANNKNQDDLFDGCAICQM